MLHRTGRLVTIALGGLLTAGTLAVGASAPAQADVRAPGSFSGFAFDACTAPSQRQMDTWWNTSPFGAIGIYISGSSRGCGQPNLTRSWVSTQASRGWRFLPLHVGMQAPCYGGRKQKMSANATTARSQGVAAATESVRAASALGIGRGHVLYLDIEAYAINDAACNAAVVRFVDGWTARLHDVGYRSGLYSSASAAIAAMDRLKRARTSGYHYPDHLWIGWYNGRTNLTAEPYLDDAYWASGSRVHQYRGTHTARYGGVAGSIDRNVLDVGKGSRPTRPTGQCRSATVSRYPSIKPGSRHALVPVAKCLLKKGGLMSGSTKGTKHGTKSVRAVQRLQAARGIKVTGKLTKRTWVALLSRGSAPVLKRGSTGSKVYRLQRSLTAALGRSVPRTGLFDKTTETAVRQYRAKVRLPGYRTAEAGLWSRLQTGRR